MSELMETPKVTRIWCPVCEPDVDSMRELVEVSHCTQHEPNRDGVSDSVAECTADGGLLIGGNVEAGGLGNRKFCESVHRRFYSIREEQKLYQIQRMIDRIDHRIADPTYKKGHWMLAERSALVWAMRILRGDPEKPLSATVLALRGGSSDA